MMDQSLFAKSVEAIDSEYDAQGFNKGWRFLYTPSATFHEETKLWFLGLNPGGNPGHDRSPSSELGSAYRLERWGSRGRINALQKQVANLYERVAMRLDTDPVRLMDRTLKSNLLPFRSRSGTELWAMYPNWKSFARDLWTPIVEALTPAVIVSMATPTFQFFSQRLESRHGLPTTQRALTGWGLTGWTAQRFGVGPSSVLLLQVPHLARFTIFTSTMSQHASESIIDLIARELGSHAWSKN